MGSRNCLGLDSNHEETTWELRVENFWTSRHWMLHSTSWVYLWSSLHCSWHFPQAFIPALYIITSACQKSIAKNCKATSHWPTIVIAEIQLTAVGCSSSHRSSVISCNAQGQATPWADMAELKEITSRWIAMLCANIIAIDQAKVAQELMLALYEITLLCIELTGCSDSNSKALFHCEAFWHAEIKELCKIKSPLTFFSRSCATSQNAFCHWLRRPEALTASQQSSNIARWTPDVCADCNISP